MSFNSPIQDVPSLTSRTFPWWSLFLSSERISGSVQFVHNSITYKTWEESKELSRPWELRLISWTTTVFQDTKMTNLSKKWNSKLKKNLKIITKSSQTKSNSHQKSEPLTSKSHFVASLLGNTTELAAGLRTALLLLYHNTIPNTSRQKQPGRAVQRFSHRQQSCEDVAGPLHHTSFSMESALEKSGREEWTGVAVIWELSQVLSLLTVLPPVSYAEIHCRPP